MGAVQTRAGLKQREPRVPVLIGARMRASVCWADVSICNVSTRGMMLKADPPPPRGTYIEIARGPLRITARVVWADGLRCGLQTRENIDLAALTKGRKSQTRAEDVAELPTASRRRPQIDAEAKRNQARLAEFAAMLLFAGAIIGAFAVPAYEQLADTLGQVQSRL